MLGLSNRGLTMTKRVEVPVAATNSFWQTPATSAANAAIVIVSPVLATAVTLLYVGSDSPVFWYLTISPILTPLENLWPPTLTTPFVWLIVNSVPLGAGN